MMETFFRVLREKSFRNSSFSSCKQERRIPGVPRKTAGFVGWVHHSSLRKEQISLLFSL